MNNPNSPIHNRRSIRLKEYDYAQAGAYFITICTHERVPIFGDVSNGAMRLNEFGEIAFAEWINTPTIRAEIGLGEFVIMPNHLHGIIIIADPIMDNDRFVGAYGHTPLRKNLPAPSFRSPSKTVGAMVRGYKSIVAKRINLLRKTPGIAVWQRNYWEHIIRDEKSYYEIAEYIYNNPAQWESDANNPGNRS